MRILTFALLLFASPAFAGMTLTDTGSGINRTVTVESTGQYRLMLEAADNWGISQWYDLVNDPTATTNLAAELGGVGQDISVSQPGLFNQVYYNAGAGVTDAIAYTRVAATQYPNNPRSCEILENTTSRIVLKTTSNPMYLNELLSNISNQTTYYIYPDGKIYIKNSIKAVNPQTVGEWRGAVIGLADPTSTNDAISPSDTAGWIRSSYTQTPYVWNYPGEKFLYAYWDSVNSGAYNNWTKASVMLVPKAGNAYSGDQGKHNWINFKRFYYRAYNLSMSAGQTITQEYLMQLGTQGSAVLPNINSASAANAIADAYLTNPEPPAAARYGILSYAGGESSALLNWMNQRFSYKIDGLNPGSSAKWMFYTDIYGPGTIAELLALKDWATARSVSAENALLHAKINYTSTLSTAWSQMDRFDNFEGANGVLRTSDHATFTDLTASAYSGSVTWQDSMYVGYEEPFDQINLVFSTAGAEITRVWEYWNGSGWVELAVSGTGAGLTASGQVAFTPPSDWARRAVNGSRSKYFVRCRITAASTNPITSSIKGDDWLRGAGNLCRGWDAASGSIVNSGELAYNPTPPAGASAKFPYQARISYWDANHFVADPSDFQTIGGTSTRTWAKYVAYLINSRVAADGYSGVMCDDGDGDPTSAGIAPDNTDWTSGNSWSTELVEKYADIVTHTHALNPAIKVGVNSQTKALLIEGDWSLAEFHSFVWQTKVPNCIAQGTGLAGFACYDDYLPANNPTGVQGLLLYYDYADTVPGRTAAWDRGNRGPMAALTKHYVAMNENTLFNYHSYLGAWYGDTDEVYLKDETVRHQATDPIPAASLVQRWGTYFPAMGVEVGAPDTAGFNGGARSFTWKLAAEIGGVQDVWRRDFTNAIVLHRPATDETTDAEYNNYSASMALGGTYYPLSADGSVGAGITSIALRTGEGAVLLKTGGTVPPPATGKRSVPRHHYGKLH